MLLVAILGRGRLPSDRLSFVAPATVADGTTGGGPLKSERERTRAKEERAAAREMIKAVRMSNGESDVRPLRCSDG